MNAEQFPESNDVLKAPPGVPGDRCYDLPIYRYSGGVISCWRPTLEDIKRIVMGEPIYLHVEGPTHPPLMLMTATPFVPAMASAEREAEITAGAEACQTCRHFKPGANGETEGVCMKFMRTTVYHHQCEDYVERAES
jgi:hypothetical protein